MVWSLPGAEHCCCVAGAATVVPAILLREAKGMGYVRPRIIAALHFDDMPGLTINVREPTYAQWEEQIAPLLGSAADDPLQWIDAFIGVVDSWDLEYADGTAVPCTRAGLVSHDIVFVQKVLRQWMSKALVFARPEDLDQDQGQAQPAEEVDPFSGVDVTALDMVPESVVDGGDGEQS